MSPTRTARPGVIVGTWEDLTISLGTGAPSGSKRSTVTSEGVDVGLVGDAEHLVGVDPAGLEVTVGVDVFLDAAAESDRDARSPTRGSRSIRVDASFFRSSVPYATAGPARVHTDRLPASPRNADSATICQSDSLSRRVRAQPSSSRRHRSHRRDRRDRVIPPSLAPSTRLGLPAEARVRHRRSGLRACGGAMRILAILPDGDASRAILEHLGLPTEPPPPGAVGPPEPGRDDALA